METLCGNQPGPRFPELSAWTFHMPGDPGTRQNRRNPGNPAMTSNTAPNRATALLEHFQLNTIIEGTRLVGGMLKKPVIMARLPVTTVLSASAFGEKSTRIGLVRHRTKGTKSSVQIAWTSSIPGPSSRRNMKQMAEDLRH